MNEPIPFAKNADEAETELRPILEAHAERLGGSLVELWSGSKGVYPVRSADQELHWLEVRFWAEYKLPRLEDWALDNDLIELTVWKVHPFDAHALWVTFEVIVVVSEE